jgi:hypothetical protein
MELCNGFQNKGLHFCKMVYKYNIYKIFKT